MNNSIPVCVYVLLSVLTACLGVDLTYNVEEGKRPDTLIGDIADDTRLLDTVEPKDHNLIRFCQFQQGQEANSLLFRVAKKTGELYTAQALDAEALCKHTVECFRIIKVAVRRVKTFMRILKIKVIIKDVNDHQPEFPEQKVNIQFEENDSKGTKVSIPNAIDQDVGDLNSQISYQLKKNMNEPFTLAVSKTVDGTSDLSITLEDLLDREQKDSYIIQVIAKDGGSPPKQSVLDVYISVTDVNDNPPVFSQNVYNVSIMYEHDEVSPVAILSATDLDSGKNGKISYHFSSKTSDTAKSQFKINRITGEIFLHRKFTSTKKLTYKLYIKAADGGNPPLSSIALVIVNVINQQNNVPSIDVNFISGSTENSAAISEDVEVGNFIAYVMVTDPDMGQNGEVGCDLHHDKFQLQSLGPKEYKVTIKDPIDRETEDHYDITISCQDRGSPPLHSESTFSIRVTDVNDVRPKFSEEIFKFSIFENQNSKFPVGFINATDPDLGPGGQLTYSLLTDNKHFLPFLITENGLISTIMSLDHEFQDTHRFQVFVKDNGIPSLNNTVDIVVEVKDKNDNAPTFVSPSVSPFIMDVHYYPRHTTNITVLKATDLDSRENAFLKYEITAGNEKQLFSINHYTGLLSFTREASQQDSGLYDLQITVKDSGTPVLSATTDLSLKLTVSNQTYEVLNAEHVQSEDGIPMYLMTIVLLIAVSVSVPVTAAISICIIRCNDRRQAQQRAEMSSACKCLTDHGHYNCPSQQATLWSGVPAAQTPEPGNSLSSHSRRGQHSGDQLGHGRKGSASGLPRDMVYQVSDGNSQFGSEHTDGTCWSPSWPKDVHE